jgi:hypothetical protein
MEREDLVDQDAWDRQSGRRRRGRAGSGHQGCVALATSKHGVDRRAIPPPTTPSQQQLAKRPGLRDVKRHLRRTELFSRGRARPRSRRAIEVRHVDAIDFATRPRSTSTRHSWPTFPRQARRYTSRTFGKRLYWTGDEQPLTAAQLRNFRRIVRIGQGQGNS